MKIKVTALVRELRGIEPLSVVHLLNSNTGFSEFACEYSSDYVIFIRGTGWPIKY